MIQNVQISSPLNPLGQSKPNFIRVSLGKGNQLCINGSGHMTKMFAMAIHGEMFSGPISIKLGK